MSSRASGGAFAACLIIGAILGFGGGAYFGSQSGSDAAETPPDSNASTPADSAGEPTDAEEPAGDGITLTAAQTSVAANERIELSGAIEPAKAGVVVKVQRSIDGGEWTDFADGNITWETKEDGTFSGYIQSSQSGENAIRVVDVADEAVMSEPVVVTIG